MDRPAPEVLAAPGAEPVLSITIGIDGRLYCHDIAPELLPVLEELCPGEPQLRARKAAAGPAEEEDHERPES